MRFAFILPLALLATACAHDKAATPVNDQATAMATPAPGPQKTRATLSPAPKGKVNGTVRFVPEENGIRVLADIHGLKAGSKHGFHVHENGTCEPPKFESAGGHYNPSQVGHGGTHTPQRHPGDMGNLVADKKGRAVIDMVIPQSPSNDTFLGRAVIVHAKADDLKSQPTGDAGDRIACGIVEVETP